MADVKAVREQLIAELDRTHNQADAKDAADRIRALRDLEVVTGDFDTLYGGMDLSTAHASVVDQLTTHLNRSIAALRAMQPLDSDRSQVGAAKAEVSKQSKLPAGSVAAAKAKDQAVNEGEIDASTHMPSSGNK